MNPPATINNLPIVSASRIAPQPYELPDQYMAACQDSDGTFVVWRIACQACRTWRWSSAVTMPGYSEPSSSGSRGTLPDEC